MRLIHMTRMGIDNTEPILLNPDTIESVTVLPASREQVGFNRQLNIRMRNGGAAGRYAPVNGNGELARDEIDDQLILRWFKAYVAGQTRG